MRAGARLKTVILISNKLSRADPEKKKKQQVCLCLHPLVSTLMRQPKSSHESPESQICGWDNAEGLWALYTTQSGLQGQLHLRIRHYDKAEVH